MIPALIVPLVLKALWVALWATMGLFAVLSIVRHIIG